MLESFWQDVRFGARMLSRQRGFAAVAVLTLALGIGANTAVFSVVNAVLLRSLPYPDPDRLVMAWESDAQQTRTGPVSPANFLDWRAQGDGALAMAALDFGDFNVVGDGEPERLRGARVSAGLFELLGVRPLLGRSLLAEDDREGAAKVVLLSYGLWQRRFGADPHVVGRSIAVNDEPHTVAGVMPAGFDFPAQIVGEKLELWTPIAFTSSGRFDRGLRRLGVVGRLSPGVSLEAARSRMTAIARRLAQEYPREDAGVEIALVPLRTQLSSGVERPLMILLGAVGLVLLIACANVANLMLARAVGRRREIAVRAALGASAVRLFRQLLTESLLLSLLGGTLAFLVALWGTDALVLLVPKNLPRVAPIAVDGHVLLFTLGLSLATGVLFGSAPALRALRAQPEEAMRAGSRSQVGGSRGLREALLVAEVALALMLLIGAGLMVRTIRTLTEVSPGFDPRHVLTAYIALPGTRYASDERRVAVVDQILSRVGATPGVTMAAVARYLPLGSGNAYLDVTLEAGAADGKGRQNAAYWRVASPGYFRTMGIPVIRGRDFGARDAVGAPGAAIVSESMAHRLWPGRDPLGKRLKVGAPDEDAPWLEVVGVVGDVLHGGLTTSGTSELYVPYAQSPSPFITLFIRSELDARALISDVKNALAAIDPALPMADPCPMEAVVSRSIAAPRFRGVLLGLFAFVALVLSAIGVIGVMSHSVYERTRENGLRVALGAGRGDIFRLIAGRGLRLTLAGLAIGLAGTLPLQGLLRGLLYGVTATDPSTIAAVTALLGLVAFAASILPARRAAREDPMVALRHE
ncbi:MAG: ABC transporter permease [Acidobacteria bacterium]|nr:ABC transporter permease [Acidobacteriota bacterium]